MTSNPQPAPAHDAPQAQSGSPERVKVSMLGTGSIVFLVVAAAAPLTVMAGVAPLAISIGGVGAPVAYLIAGAVLATFATAFTTMTKHVGSAGAFYSYVSKGLGRTWGLAAALLALLSYNGLQIGVYGLLAVQVRQSLAELFGITVPWPVVAVAAVALVLLVGWFGIEVNAKVLGVLLVAETAILALMAFGVLFKGGAGGLDGVSFTPSAAFAPGMAAAIGIGFAAYMGFESTALYRREARRPERTIPRATYLAVGFMAIFYAFVTWAAIQAYGSADAVGVATTNAPGMFFGIIERYVGGWAGTAMNLLIVTSVLAAQIAFYNAITRYMFVLSAEGVLPAWVGVLHPRHGSPNRAGIVQSVLALVVILAFVVAKADPYQGLLLWVNSPGVVGILVLETLTAVAVVVYFLRRNRAAMTRRAVIAGTVSAILLAAATYLVVDHIALFTQSGPMVNAVLLSLVPLSLVAGAVIALRLRVRRPDVYARIGEGDAGDVGKDAL
ncbi:amino acid transporter [Kibdelosporangium banguiense]|uniref:Amino acid transporter n=1 Tax=Kibdelosporangium banguiense TaxID=1365924 RepID=A0ABS4TZ83_9PSEU|nr:APC family permease [Kibdelosporangium banguiense]MBP2329216.1 amino acid transporter [Kibdelosporangium banguiense]